MSLNILLKSIITEHKEMKLEKHKDIINYLKLLKNEVYKYDTIVKEFDDGIKLSPKILYINEILYNDLNKKLGDKVVYFIYSMLSVLKLAKNVVRYNLESEYKTIIERLGYKKIDLKTKKVYGDVYYFVNADDISINKNNFVYGLSIINSTNPKKLKDKLKYEHKKQYKSLRVNKKAVDEQSIKVLLFESFIKTYKDDIKMKKLLNILVIYEALENYIDNKELINRKAKEYDVDIENLLNLLTGAFMLPNKLKKELFNQNHKNTISKDFLMAYYARFLIEVNELSN